MPAAGDVFTVVGREDTARDLAEARRKIARESEAAILQAGSEHVVYRGCAFCSLVADVLSWRQHTICCAGDAKRSNDCVDVSWCVDACVVEVVLTLLRELLESIHAIPAVQRHTVLVILRTFFEVPQCTRQTRVVPCASHCPLTRERMGAT